MQELLPIPANPAEVTTSWLTAALQAWLRATSATPLNFTVSRFTVTPLGENRGFYGEPVRLTLEYQGDAISLPHTLIAKFSSANPAMRQRALDSYLREVRFYQYLAPHSDLPVPRCYHAAIDTNSGNHILLLQEIAPAKAITRIAGCTLDQARLAIQAITKLHSRWWGRTEQPALDWLPDPPAPQDDDAMRQRYDEWWSAFYQQAEAQIPAGFVETSRTLGNHLARLRRHLFHGAPRTLIHRDYQLDNLIFRQVGGREELAILDWQFLSRGRGVWDLAYFLSESLQPPGPEKREPEKRALDLAILRDYHSALCEQGIEAIDDYSFAQCLQDFRYALLQRHVALVSTIAAMPFSAEQRHIHLNVLLPRNIAAIRDHGAQELLQ